MEHKQTYYKLTSNTIGFTIIGLLYAINLTHWRMCGIDAFSILRYFTFGTAMFMLGLGISIVARHYKWEDKLVYGLDKIIRLLLIISVSKIALLKSKGIFFQYSLFDHHSKLAGLEANPFTNIFYGLNPYYQSIMGYAVLIGLVLLAFGITKRLGVLMLVGLFAHDVIMSYALDNCFLFKSSVFLAASTCFVINEFSSYASFLTNNPNSVKQGFNPLKSHPHIYQSITMFKIILLVGLYFYSNDLVKVKDWYANRNIDSPITGIWNVKEVKFLQSNVNVEDQEKIKQFNSIILDQGRFGAVEIGDSLSFFEYLINPEYNQLELWNFQDFYDFSFKGKYYKMTQDSMVYIGRNNRDSLIISLKLSDDIFKK